jgi:hypothetical protein
MTPRQAAQVLAANHELGPGPLRPATVGGVNGVSIELTPRTADDIFGRTVVYTVAKDRSYRLTFLHTPESMLVIMAVAIHRPPDAAFARAGRVVDSVRFA